MSGSNSDKMDQDGDPRDFVRGYHSEQDEKMKPKSSFDKRLGLHVAAHENVSNAIPFSPTVKIWQQQSLSARTVPTV